MIQCSNKIPEFDPVECGNIHPPRTEVPKKYSFLFNLQGYIDLPIDELLPGNKYATKKMTRIVKKK